MNLKKIVKNKVIKNAGWLIGGKIINKILAFIVGILTARYLGPGNYGLINYAAAYTTFFAAVCSLGINSIIVKNFLEFPDEQEETLGTALVLKGIASLLSAVMITGIVYVVDRNEPVTLAVVILSSLSLIFQIYDTFQYWFQSRLQSKYPAIATNIAYIVVSVFKVILLILGKDVRWFALSNSLDYIVAGVFLFVIYKKSNGKRLSFSIRKGKQLLSKSCSFIISGLMVSIYASTDKLMLKRFLSESEVAYYSLASTLSVTWAFVLTAVIDSMYPVIVEKYQTDYASYERKNRQLYGIVFYAAMLMSVLIAGFSGPIIQILYGEKYLGAIVPLRIVVWYTAFSYLGVARNAWMVCEDKQKYLNILYPVAAVSNVLLNYLLIPKWGASGAAAASLVTQIITTTVLPAMIRPLRPNVRLMLEAVACRDLRKNKKTRS
ncbi:MAG: flippase [Eubacteriales bacterium]|nr:flippase [Eubacteriales bacterium]